MTRTNPVETNTMLHFISRASYIVPDKKEGGRRAQSQQKQSHLLYTNTNSLLYIITRAHHSRHFVVPFTSLLVRLRVKSRATFLFLDSRGKERERTKQTDRREDEEAVENIFIRKIDC